MSISGNQLEREAVVLLRRLAVPLSYLEPSAEAVGWSVMVARNRFAKPVAHVEAVPVSAMLRAGWLKREPLGRLVISVTGCEWLQARGLKPRAQLQSAVSSKRKVRSRSTRIKSAILDQQTPIVNDAESPLAWLASRKGPDGTPLLTQQMFDAGEKLRSDFEFGQMGARVTASWDGSILSGARGRSGLPGQNMTQSEAALCARQRVWAALQGVGPGLSSILLEVCCLASGLEAAERHLKWPKRSAKLVLVLALERLADHYGLYPAATATGRAPRVRAWGIGDYRPELLGHLRSAARSEG
jgi:hypothetical protein